MILTSWPDHDIHVCSTRVVRWRGEEGPASGTPSLISTQACIVFVYTSIRSFCFVPFFQLTCASMLCIFFSNLHVFHMLLHHACLQLGKTISGSRANLIHAHAPQDLYRAIHTMSYVLKVNTGLVVSNKLT